VTTQAVDVHVVPTDAPDDTSGLVELFDSGTVRPEDVICILGKTEGNGCVNDFSRGLASRAYRDLLADRLGVASDSVHEEVLLIMSGGTEGVLTPHVTVFSRRDAVENTTPDEKRLTAGIATTAKLRPEELGRSAQVTATADAVKTAMTDAGITDPDNVEFVQIKCPLLTADRMAEARERGNTVVVQNTYKSMAYSRGASALGVAIATGEIPPDEISGGDICDAQSVYSTCASTSAGVELTHSEVIVLGNSEGAASSFVIGSSVMEDALDTQAVNEAIDTAAPDDTDSSVTNVFAKAQASRSGSIRGRRHVIHNDSVIEATRHARSVVNAVIGAVTGDPLSYISGGAEHQGPDGGGPVAAILELD
jgi:cyanuric acid amidohydrolase